MTYTALDEFCGFGGSSQGLHCVPGLDVAAAANHAPIAIEVHELNFPDAHHYRGDIARADVTKWIRVDFAWFSPVCPPFSTARGKRRDFDKSTQGLLFNYLTAKQLEDAALQAQRRALMEEVPRYLRAMTDRGEPVLAGVVENVVEVMQWDQFKRWRKEIEQIGYKTKVIALNSMHARGRETKRAPQSRDRFYMAIWHIKLQRDPDFAKWLRARAWCPQCDGQVDAIQVFKKPGNVMGRYRAQYTYRCPIRHRRQVDLEPYFQPAAAAIDWSMPGERIVDKKPREFFLDKEKTQSVGFHPLAPKTLARIEAGLRKYARDESGNPLEFDGPGPYARMVARHEAMKRAAGFRDDEDEAPDWTEEHARAAAPGFFGDRESDEYLDLFHEEPAASQPYSVQPNAFTLEVAGNTFERKPGVRTWPASAAPLTTQTTTATKAILAPPMIANAGGSWNETPQPVDAVLRTITTTETAGVAPPLLVPVEGRLGKSANTAADMMRTQTTRNETGVAVPPLVMRNNSSRASNGPLGGGYLSVPVERALGTLTTSGHQSVIAPPFVAELRGGGSVAREVTQALATVTASGNHHGVVVPQLTMAAWGAIYGYDTGLLRSLLDALPTQTTVQGDALLTGTGLPDVGDCLFRMLEPHEIAVGMGFFPDYKVKGTKRAQVRGYGNAVTPTVAEILGCCLMEAITGEAIERDLVGVA